MPSPVQTKTMPPRTTWWEFTLSLDPPRVSHHTKGISRGRLYDKPALKAARLELIWSLTAYKPPLMLNGPLRVDIVWRFPWRAGDSARTRAKGDAPYPKKPDLDNLMKTFVDCMVKCEYFTNDSQIVDARIRKFLSDSPGISVTLEELCP